MIYLSCWTLLEISFLREGYSSEREKTNETWHVWLIIQFRRKCKISLINYSSLYSFQFFLLPTSRTWSLSCADTQVFNREEGGRGRERVGKIFEKLLVYLLYVYKQMDKYARCITLSFFPFLLILRRSIFFNFKIRESGFNLRNLPMNPPIHFLMDPPIYVLCSKYFDQAREIRRTSQSLERSQLLLRNLTVLLNIYFHRCTKVKIGFHTSLRSLKWLTVCLLAWWNTGGNTLHI